jgi:transposase
MVIQQARSLSVLVSFLKKNKRIIEELLRQCVSQCVFVERLN